MIRKLMKGKLLLRFQRNALEEKFGSAYQASAKDHVIDE